MTEATPDIERPMTSAEPRKRRRVVAALRSPSGKVIPHPALDVAVDEAAQSRRRGIDWVVFGVTAAT